jgi:hypothetical protein
LVRSSADGTRKQTGLGLTLKPNAHLPVALRADRNDITLVECRFYTQVLTARADYNFTPNGLLAEPAAVRQRITRPRLPESLPMDSETGQRFVRRDQPRVGENIRRVVRRDLQPHVFETSVHVSVLKSFTSAMWIDRHNAASCEQRPSDVEHLAKEPPAFESTSDKCAEPFEESTAMAQEFCRRPPTRV